MATSMPRPCATDRLIGWCAFYLDLAARFESPQIIPDRTNLSGMLLRPRQPLAPDTPRFRLVGYYWE